MHHYIGLKQHFSFAVKEVLFLHSLSYSKQLSLRREIPIKDPFLLHMEPNGWTVDQTGRIKKGADA